MAGRGQTSPLVVAEYLASGDARFLDALRNCQGPKRLGPIADRWKQDHRPWARQQIFAYLDLPLNRPGHEPVVKRLFKHAEERHDDELMAAFMVTFDRLVRRVVRRWTRYEWRSGRTSTWQEEYLKTPHNVVAKPPKGKMPLWSPSPPREGDRLFSYRTRYYLRRRAWRYFRQMAFRRPADYPAAIARALRLYADDDLRTGENLLDNWGLLHACFGMSDVIEFTSSSAKPRPGRGLAELAPAPYFPELWAKPTSARLLLDLALGAAARPVRVWATQLVRRDHRTHLSDLAADDLLRLLDHPDEELQQLGAELLEANRGLASLPLPTWLRLLRTRNLTALETIARLMRLHIKPDRLDLAQCVELAIAEPVPVARLGLEFLKSRRIASAADREALADLSTARSAGVAREIAAYALTVLGTPEHYDVEQVSRFFDALLAPTRAAAWDWLTGHGNAAGDGAPSAGYDDPALWSRLLETPYDDLKMSLVAELRRRTELPGATPDALTLLWCSVLLNVYRGGRAKLTALRQVSDALRRYPDRAESLLPALAVALRSVRLPEARAGLSAILSVVASRPDLAPAVSRFVPELDLAASTPALAEGVAP